ncbi:MAG: hypothetical protein C0603_04635 [Denitrovibrio sp.]|nr:MAG: hypothetical protein C0603_04635 [Denitrovibrio sp.]
MSKKYTVFTYGSLMKGFYGNDTLMKDAEFIGEATVDGNLRFFCSDYPVMIKKDDGKSSVKGELYHVDEVMMERLRSYEGVGSPLTCYTEKVIKAKTEEGDVPARAFVAMPGIAVPVKLSSRSIPEGDWRLFKSSSRWLPVAQPLQFYFVAIVIGTIFWQMGLI